MLTNLVRICVHVLELGSVVSSEQQPCHFMHIKSGVYPFLPMFEILAKEDLNPGDV